MGCIFAVNCLNMTLSGRTQVIYVVDISYHQSCHTKFKFMKFKPQMETKY